MGLVLTMSPGQLIPRMCQAVSVGFVAPDGTSCCWDLLTQSPAGVTQPRGLGRMQWCRDAAAGRGCWSTGTASWPCNDILGGEDLLFLTPSLLHSPQELLRCEDFDLRGYISSESSSCCSSEAEAVKEAPCPWTLKHKVSQQFLYFQSKMSHSGGELTCLADT